MDMWTDLAIIESYLSMAFVFIQDKAVEFYAFAAKKAIEIANSPRAQNLAISAIWIVCSVETQVSLFLKGLYDDNRLIRGPVDLVYFLVGNVAVKQAKNEPERGNWFRLHKLVKDGDDFSLVITTFDLNQDLKTTINNYVDELGNIPKSDLYFSAKHEDHYIVRTLEKVEEIVVNEAELRFINIEYTHPLQDVPINIKLKAAYYVVGNELFSPAFVLNALENQPAEFYFDKDYVLNLMDSDVTTFSITSNQYILIEAEETYVIKEFQ
jgi:hypothetical protein